MNKQALSERDICTKFTTPALKKAGWDVLTQMREEFLLTKGRIIVRGKLHTRGQHKRADYVELGDPDELMAEYQDITRQLQAAQQALKTELLAALKATSGGQA